MVSVFIMVISKVSGLISPIGHTDKKDGKTLRVYQR